jgi:hypothetical protein
MELAGNAGGKGGEAATANPLFLTPLTGAQTNMARISKRVGSEAGQALGDHKASKREKSEAGEILRQLRDRKQPKRKKTARKTTRRISRR